MVPASQSADICALCRRGAQELACCKDGEELPGGRVEAEGKCTPLWSQEHVWMGAMHVVLFTVRRMEEVHLACGYSQSPDLANGFKWRFKVAAIESCCHGPQVCQTA